MDYRNWKITHQRIKSFKFSKWRPNYRGNFLISQKLNQKPQFYICIANHVQGFTPLKIKARIEFLLLFDVIKKKKKSKLICHNTDRHTHIDTVHTHTDTSSDRISVLCWPNAFILSCSKASALSLLLLLWEQVEWLPLHFELHYSVALHNSNTGQFLD